MGSDLLHTGPAVEARRGGDTSQSARYPSMSVQIKEKQSGLFFLSNLSQTKTQEDLSQQSKAATGKWLTGNLERLLSKVFCSFPDQTVQAPPSAAGPDSLGTGLKACCLCLHQAGDSPPSSGEAFVW